MASSPPVNCSTCNAWWATTGSAGLCKAHPPLPTLGAHWNQPGSNVPKLEFYFPTMAATDWCREHVAGIHP